MKTTLYKAADRGTADYGWLKPNYYFSFAQYHDPAKVHFGLLRVLNDDFVDGGGGGYAMAAKQLKMQKQL